MCGSRKAPTVTEVDPVDEQRKAEAKAATSANLELAARRKRRSQSSLLSLGAQGLTRSSGSSLLASAAAGTTDGGS